MSEGNHEDVAAPFGLGIIGAGRVSDKHAAAANVGAVAGIVQPNDRFRRAVRCGPNRKSNTTQAS